MAKFFIVLAAAVAMCAASSIREKRQAFNVCNGQVNGAVPDPDDCSYFFLCGASGGSRAHCQEGLEFNPQTSQCDFPNNVVNPQCQRRSQGSLLNARCNGLNGVVHISHETFCNGFLTCENGKLKDGCTFCPENNFFDANSHRCIWSTTSNVLNDCQGRRYVEHANKAIMSWAPSCYPHHPELFAPLRAKHPEFFQNL